MTRLSSLLLLLLLIIYEVIAERVMDPCRATMDGQYDEGMTGYSTKDCQVACAAQTWDGSDANGMCVLDRCYCTDVGVGTCQDHNHEGCDAICQKLSLDWIGVCSDGECNCLF